ncbi:ABC transporter substrate-binding protein [Dickeya fangzhongdai]|uniref:ABC transporter substrate-binding protein n=1 Tax=Dickeya fangzhongdai TaxID=1778540 RepID=UPI0026E0639F|nr:ABC transporter substrate-binding protein [Dickeya fangzhongdai]WKV52394.1 ABC transporter substrate-binding protein [Dickeya fangzhongdai]
MKFKKVSNIIKLMSLPALLLHSFSALATTYPVKLTDIDGNNVEISHEPQRIVVQDGRDILAIALLDRANPFKRIVAWNNILLKSDKGMFRLLEEKWGNDIKPILDMKNGDDGQVNLEQILAQKPDLMIVQLRAKQALKESGVLEKLSALKIPVIFIDTSKDPIVNTPRSIDILGEALNKEKEAMEYVSFYNQHLSALKETIATISYHPKVFLEAKAGQDGPESCCYTHANSGWGKLLDAVSADNIAKKFFKDASYGQANIETVISEKPDVYIATGSQWGHSNSIALPFGYNVSEKDIQSNFSSLQSRTAFEQISAVKNKRFYGVYHQFYNHPYNIVGVEILAKEIYPQQFDKLEPTATYQAIINDFTTIPDKSIILYGKSN